MTFPYLFQFVYDCFIEEIEQSHSFDKIFYLSTEISAVGKQMNSTSIIHRLVAIFV